MLILIQMMKLIQFLENHVTDHNRTKLQDSAHGSLDCGPHMIVRFLFSFGLSNTEHARSLKAMHIKPDFLVTTLCLLPLYPLDEKHKDHRAKVGGGYLDRRTAPHTMTKTNAQGDKHKGKIRLVRPDLRTRVRL